MGSIMNTLPLPRRLPIALGLFLVPACGSDSMAPSGGGPAISVAVVPATASLLTSGSQDFTATVANDPSNSGVTWSITGCSGGPAACGSPSPITTTPAPPTPPPTGAVPPAPAGPPPRGSQAFTATGAKAPRNRGVTWSITGCSGAPAACGSLSRITPTQATYPAPPTGPPGGGVWVACVVVIRDRLPQ